MILTPLNFRRLDSASLDQITVIFEGFEAQINPEDVVTRVQYLIDCVGNIGSFGAFAGRYNQPGSSCVKLLQSRVEPHRHVYDFTIQNAAPVVGTILFQLGLYVHSNIAKLNKFDLLLPQIWPSIDDKNMPRLLYTPLPFEYSYEENNSEVQLEIEFFNQIDSEQEKLLEKIWDSWLYLAALGILGPEICKPDETLAVPSGFPDFVQNSVSFFLEDASLPESAFDGLINCLHALHQHGASIEYVRIE